MPPSSQNPVDDYYAQPSGGASSNGDSQKSGPKIKIKAKRRSDEPQEGNASGGTESSNTSSDASGDASTTSTTGKRRGQTITFSSEPPPSLVFVARSQEVQPVAPKAPASSAAVRSDNGDTQASRNADAKPARNGNGNNDRPSSDRNRNNSQEEAKLRREASASVAEKKRQDLARPELQTAPARTLTPRTDNRNDKRPANRSSFISFNAPASQESSITFISRGGPVAPLPGAPARTGDRRDGRNSGGSNGSRTSGSSDNRRSDGNTSGAPRRPAGEGARTGNTGSGGGHAPQQQSSAASSGANANNKRKGPSFRDVEQSDRQYATAKKGIKVRGGESTGDTSEGSFRRSKKSNHSGRRHEEKPVEEIRQTLIDKTGQEVVVSNTLSVKEFSEKIGVPMGKILAELLKNGIRATLNLSIDFDTAFLIAETFGIILKRDDSVVLNTDALLTGNISALVGEEDPNTLVERAPIVSIMGHVDHGKTSILDRIRRSTVAQGEAGGITQKIGAYQVEREGRKITFLDTPGHEAFSMMRARGSRLTDVVVLVVAADEGIKPQTIESLNMAREAGVPIIVAMNKMDKPGVNVDMVKGQLAEHGLTSEDWGGSTIMVGVSALTGLGIETLLDMILLSTEMLELKANPNRPALATVIESHLDPKLGPVASVLVNTGTLRRGDAVACGGAFGRVRVLRDFTAAQVETATPSMPVLVVGLNGVVAGGDILRVLPHVSDAEDAAKEFLQLRGDNQERSFGGASLDLLMSRMRSGALKQLKVVLKTDSNGSLEALRTAITSLSTSETQVNIIHAGVGDVSDSDVEMAGVSEAILIGFNVSTTQTAKVLLGNSKVEFLQKSVIYHILERLQEIITGMIEVKYEEIALGTAEVKQLFYTSKERLIVGLGVKTGMVENRAKIRILRAGQVVGQGEILNLKMGPTDVPSAEAPSECGISLKSDTTPEVGDMLQVYKTVRVTPNPNA